MVASLGGVREVVTVTGGRARSENSTGWRAQSMGDQRELVASACRVLAHRGLVSGILGHVSARVGDGTFLIRCRSPRERGLAASTPDDVHRIDGRGELVDAPDGWSAPKEHPIHTSLYEARPEVGAVVHAHPRSALLCGLADLPPRPVFGAFNIPAMRMALDGCPSTGGPYSSRGRTWRPRCWLPWATRRCACCSATGSP